VILLLVILVMRKRLQLAVALFQEAGKVLEASPMILIQPIWTYLYQIICVAFGIFMLIIIASVSKCYSHPICTELSLATLLN